MTFLELVLLGGFQAGVAGNVIDIAGRKERALLAEPTRARTRRRDSTPAPKTSAAHRRLVCPKMQVAFWLTGRLGEHNHEK
jgi:hypothetical protein